MVPFGTPSVIANERAWRKSTAAAAIISAMAVCVVSGAFAQPVAERDRRLAERLLRAFDGHQAWERYWLENRPSASGPAGPITVAFVETPSFAGACFPAREACALFSWSSGGTLHVLSVRPIGKNVSDDDALTAAGALVGDARQSGPMRGDLSIRAGDIDGVAQRLAYLWRHVVTLEKAAPFGAYLPRQRRDGVQSPDLIKAATEQARSFRLPGCAPATLMAPRLFVFDPYAYVYLNAGGDRRCRSAMLLFQRTLFDTWHLEKFVIRPGDIDFLKPKLQALQCDLIPVKE
ncbi:MAG: hypothetical protein IT162_10680 [Bryobacterales bacterium]|nr:hypothetical protein [Bryobacterales bacterium]